MGADTLICPTTRKQFTEAGETQPVTLPCNHSLTICGAEQVRCGVLLLVLLLARSGARCTLLCDSHTSAGVPQVLGKNGSRACPVCKCIVPDGIGVADLPLSGEGFNAMHNRQFPKAKFECDYPAGVPHSELKGKVRFVNSPVMNTSSMSSQRARLSRVTLPVSA